MRPAQYTLLKKLGQGGMAEVFEGEAKGASGFARRVVIKKMRADVEDAQSQRMFLDEARIAGQLHHANIVGVLDYGVWEDGPFQVHELIEGLDLGALLSQAEARGEALPEALALLIAMEVAHALDYAHEAADASGRPLGIVHRDVKPGNILVSWAGDVKLTDFGVAFAHQRTERTLPGLTKGTPVYMSPEQAAARSLDGRSDIFSLGCVLHRALTGASPISSMAALLACIDGEDLEISDGVSEDLQPVLRRALAADRTQRYATCAQMAQALGRALTARVQQAPKILLREWMGSHREVPQAPALDQLLNFELFLEEEADGVRRFDSKVTPSKAPQAGASNETSPMRPPRLQTRSLPGLIEAPDTTAKLHARGSTSRLRIALGLLALGALAALAIILTRAPDPVQVVALVEPAPPSAKSPMKRAVASDAGTKIATKDAGSKAPPKRRRRTKVAPATKLASPECTQSRECHGALQCPGPGVWRCERGKCKADCEVVLGVLVVGGEGALKAEILVDGRRAGFAPKRLELPVGQHLLLLRGPGGTIAKKKVQLTVRHTRRTPLRWLVPLSAP